MLADGRHRPGDGAIFEITAEIHEKDIVPEMATLGARLNLEHIHFRPRQRRENLRQNSNFIAHRKEDRNLSSGLRRHLVFVAHNDKSGYISCKVLDSLLENLQTVSVRGLDGSDRRTGLVARSLLNRAISVFDISDTQGAVGILCQPCTWPLVCR